MMNQRVFCVIAGAALAALVAPATPCAAQQADAQAIRQRGWAADIDTVVAVAQRVHAGPRRQAHSAAFRDAAERLKRSAPSLSDRRLVVELQRLLALLGDGHSLVYPAPARAASFGMLPIDVYLFSDGLFIVAADSAHAALIGSRIDRIGALPTDALIRRMTPYVSRDNAIGVRAFASLYIPTLMFLEAFGAASDSSKATVQLSGRDGRQRAVVIAAGNARRTPRRIVAPPAGHDSLPTYLQHTESPFWSMRLAAPRTIYAQFNQVMNPTGSTLANAAAALRDTLTATFARHLILDVRHNNGGNNHLLAPLLDVIAAFASDTTRTIHVITSRATFSAAQNFINRVEQRVPRTVFAGEPSMSSPNFTGEDNPVRLPYSGLTVSISNRYWQDSRADDRRPWIAPQLPVELSSADWWANRDPVLAAVLADIARRR